MNQANQKMSADDVEALLPWLDWAFAEASQPVAAA